MHWKLLWVGGLSFLLGGCGNGGDGGENAPQVGSIRVAVEFSGANFDQAEPRLVLDGTTTRTGVASKVTFSDVAPGNHEISLQGLHARCMRAGAASQSVAVTGGQTTEVRYAVNCRDIDQLALVVPRADVPGGVSLRVIDVDGQRERELFTPQGIVSAPAWSKDGRRLAIRYTDTSDFTQGAVWSLNADGTQMRKLWSAPYYTARQIAWSADGTRLSVVAYQYENANLFSREKLVLMDADGGNVIELPAITGGISASWAPDGSQLVAAFDKVPSSSPGPSGMYVVDKSGTLGLQLIAGNAEPAWSPDGSLIAFTTTGGDLHTVRPDGTQLKELAVCPPSGCWYASWSPDSSRIAVSTPDDIRIVDREAQLMGPVIPTGNMIYRPTWAPSSQYLAWSPFSSTLVKVAEPDGTNERTLVEGSSLSINFVPAWRP